MRLPPLVALLALPIAAAAEKPLMKDFMGICVHTVNFKPKLYQPVTNLVRDYHPVSWDLGEDTQASIDFPKSKNNVHWENMYEVWVDYGYEIDAALMFNHFETSDWKDMPTDAHRYAKAFASYFGPSSRNLVTSAEVGNEPGHYSDEDYRTLFQAFASGLREGDPKLKVVTGNLTAGESDKYAKSVDLLRGLGDLYDVLKVHVYAEVEHHPSWRRTEPEDPAHGFLSRVQDVIDWRDEHAPDKEVWVTEFGWDAPNTSDEAKAIAKKSGWLYSTETEQARYLVRAYLCFSGMEVDRAYIYFFNDKDEVSHHAASGLTRNYVPKPAFYAVAHLHETLGDYRYTRIVEDQPGKCLVYEYQSGTDPKDFIWVAWSPTGSEQTTEVTLSPGNLKASKAERMPLDDQPVPAMPIPHTKDGNITLRISESPTYIFLRKH